ncbi:MAG TPA: ATP-binding cassette domain-containing protein, partial [Pseudonocardiaceae bacterium]|nr:ATP-binding cassette domain-containing protein [Pseudonocardiaceae bacterium]
RVAEQLSYFAELHGLSAALAQRNSESWMDRLDLRQHRADQLQKLSLGNQQRAQLAAALVADPEALVLDEPFSGLDPIAIDVLGQVLRERAAAGVPVLFSSHQLDLVERLCDRVGIVQNGRMVATGSVTELRQRGPVIVVVDAPEARTGWAGSIPGARVRTVDGTRTFLELADDTDDQAVLRAALDTGPVREFSRHRASLTELFRDVLASNGSDRRGRSR